MLLRRRLWLPILAAAATAFWPALYASGPVYWVVATQADFLKGQSDGVSVDELGRLLPAPVITLAADATTPQVWSLVAAADGTWYAGTGSEGKVVRGRGTQTTALLDTTETAVHALALSGNRLFAASSPDGRVHVVEADGSSRVFFDPTERYIWALAMDRRGQLWVGAGTPAVIYRVDPAGTSRVVFKPTAGHVVSLAVDASGRVFAGTEAPARLYRFDDADRPFVVMEPGLSELRAILPLPDGSLYVAAMNPGESASSSDGVTGSVTVTVAGASTSGGTNLPPAPTTPANRRSVIYRVSASGIWDVVWETPDTIYDLADGGEDTVLAATGGTEGRLYRVRPNGTALLWNAVDARQVTRLARVGDRYLLATANPGRVMSLDRALTPAATYISAVRDSKGLATWGTIRWEATGGVTLQTRSGNTEQPDQSWGEWSPALTTREGEAVRSPAARYLQWKATLTLMTSGPPPVLTSVTVAYLPRNAKPVVASITVHPPGVVFQRPFSSEDGAVAGMDDATANLRRPPGPDPNALNAPALGRRMFQRGLQTFVWKAEDADGDRLTFALSYRREGETEWRELKSGLGDALYVWDTTAVPDGRYVLRVVASDAASNTADRVLTGDRESDAFEIDNTPPVITVSPSPAAAAPALRVVVKDAQSGILRVEYSLGGGTWQLLSPADGLADSREERYELPLAAASDAARIVIRATDVMQNVGSSAGR